MSENLQARRATVDDLGVLRRIWRQHGLAEGELEKKLTEFQIVETPCGELVGAIGLELAGKEGIMHSAACPRKEIEGEVRIRFWERIQALARNHGIFRLWIEEKQPFWRSQGFVDPDVSHQKKLPEGLREKLSGWLVLPLRNETVDEVNLEKEFELFKQSQEEWSRRALHQAKALRFVAILILVAAFIGAIWVVWYVVRHMER